MRRALAILLILIMLLAAVAFGFGYRIPSLSWVFSLGGIGNEELGQVLSRVKGLQAIDWSFLNLRLGWLSGLAALSLGGWLAWRLWQGKLGKINEGDRRRWRRFKEIRRGYVAFWIVLALVGLSLLDFLLVGSRALVVKTDTGLAFPAFRIAQYQNTDFGLEGAQEPDYRALATELEKRGKQAWVLMPPVPWAPTLDSDVEFRRELSLQEGKLYGQAGQLFSGVVIAYHESTQEGEIGARARQARVREGVLQGTEERFDEQGKLLGFVRWEQGRVVERGEGVPAEFAQEGEAALLGLQETLFNPLPPLAQRRHWLGTDSKGWDVLAQLYGGWQLILRGLFMYLVVVYFLGILIGTAMGYFGGVFDVVTHRMTEILSAVPLLLLIMILGKQLEGSLNIFILVGLFCLFRWIGVAMYLRTLTYREKARDYVLAARSMGAGTIRILWKHILPNTVALLVTLLPFEMVFFSGFLTALDFIGYGLPEHYPSWGRLMADGLSQLTAPWIVSSVFVALTAVLLLFTFIGEAVREAFDPKKFSTYQ